MTTAAHPLPHEVEIGSFLLAELWQIEGALGRAGIDMRALGDAEAAVKDFGIDPWSDRMGVAVPREDADRAREVIAAWRNEQEARIRQHSKNLPWVMLRVATFCLGLLWVCIVISGSWRGHVVPFGIASVFLLVSAGLELGRYLRRGAKREAEADGHSWFDSKRGRVRRR